MHIYTAEVLGADRHTACGQLWIDLLPTQQAVHGYWDQGKQDSAPAFVLRVQKAYKPVLPGFPGQRSEENKTKSFVKK